MPRVLIWDLPTRLFHWLLAGGFFAAFAIAQFGSKRSEWFTVHAIVGLLIGLMVVMRLVWGIFGSRHARLGTLLFGFGAVSSYLKGIVRGEPNRYTGHNPASSWAILAMLTLTLLIGVTGLLTAYGYHAFEEVHSLLVYVMLGVVGIHVAGVIVHIVRHRENIAMAMISGRKEADANHAIRSASPVAAVVFLIVVGTIAFGLLRNHDPAAKRTSVPWIGTTIQLAEQKPDRGRNRSERRIERHDD